MLFFVAEMQLTISESHVKICKKICWDHECNLATVI